MRPVEVIADRQAAIAALDPIRVRLLAELRTPASAAALADRVGLTRQKVNYHLRILEGHGLVEAATTRRWGGLTERLMVATADAYLVSPDALSEEATDPSRSGDRLSVAYLIALASRLIREVGGMARAAEQRGTTLPVMGLDTAVRFRSPADRAAFAAELAESVTNLVARYHDEEADDGRWQRVLVGMHAVPADQTTTAHPEATRPPLEER